MLQSSIKPTVDLSLELLVELPCAVDLQPCGSVILIGNREQVNKAKAMLLGPQPVSSDDDDDDDDADVVGDDADVTDDDANTDVAE